MKKYVNIIVKGILAGLCISLGGWVFVRLQNNNFIMSQLNAPFMFSIALSLICCNGFLLYTGKICYLFDKTDDSFKLKCLTLGLMLLGNYIGVLITSNLLKLSFDNSKYIVELINSKTNLLWYDCLIRGFFCGILVYFAVDSYKENKKYGLLILCVMAFILSGFEHSIADMFYLSLDNTITWLSFRNIILIIIGNSLGGLFVPLLKKI